MSNAEWGALDRLVDTAMQQWRIPGLALALVQGDDITLCKGYGVRDLAGSAPVTPSTRFMICSLTKSFTAAGLGVLIDEGKLAWDTVVREVLPDFALRDATATQALTVADLLAHRSGLPSHDRIWSPPEARARDEMVAAMRHLAPSRALGEVFQYSNLGYVVAGAIIERISGQRWEDFTATRLLDPLGFTGYGFSSDDLEAAPDHAHPHPRDGERVDRGRLWPMHAAPAGGINTGVADMARWVRMLLAQGRIVDGHHAQGGAKAPASLVSASVVRAMMTPQIPTFVSDFAEIGQCHYGFGLMCEHYRGDRTVLHTGSLPGWGTLMLMMPAHRIGVVVLTNRDPGPVREMIAYAVFDQLRGHAPIDWLSIFATRRRQALADEAAEAQCRKVERLSAPALNRPLGEFAGRYRHPAYGEISIVHDGEALRWQWRGVGGTLAYRADGAFDMRENGEARYPSGLRLRFERDRHGAITSLTSPLEPAVADIRFARPPDPSAGQGGNNNA